MFFFAATLPQHYTRALRVAPNALRTLINFDNDSAALLPLTPIRSVLVQARKA